MPQQLVIWTLLLISVGAERFSYNGYKVYQVLISNETQLNALASSRDNDKIDFWSPLHFNGNPVDVMVEPEEQESFMKFLSQSNLSHRILIANVEEVIQQERYKQLAAPFIPEGRISFEDYHRHRKINAYLDELSQKYPNLVQVENVGTSFQKRELKLIKISTKPSANKPIIFIDAGIHAREWIAPAQALYIIHQLVENSKNAQLLEKVDWHILPVVNPDGYEYSHKVERLWRKTRSRGFPCKGTDGNRNYDFHWGGRGSSGVGCAPTYRGKSAFSEKETQAVRDHVLKNKDNIKLYLTLHSYGNYILFPWGHTKSRPNNYEELLSLGKKVAESIRQVRGTRYTVGSTSEVLYMASGTSEDWVKGKGGVELSYTIELPGGGSWGFDLPPSEIVKVVPETWAGIKTFHDYIKEKFGRDSNEAIHIYQN